MSEINLTDTMRSFLRAYKNIEFTPVSWATWVDVRQDKDECTIGWGLHKDVFSHGMAKYDPNGWADAETDEIPFKLKDGNRISRFFVKASMLEIYWVKVGKLEICCDSIYDSSGNQIGQIEWEAFAAELDLKSHTPAIEKTLTRAGFQVFSE
jgi:hypothetical protein